MISAGFVLITSQPIRAAQGWGSLDRQSRYGECVPWRNVDTVLKITWNPD